MGSVAAAFKGNLSRYDTPTLYAIPGSPSSWRVWLSLGLAGIDHAVETLSFNAGDTRDPAFLVLNPRGQVPVLVDGELVLTESFAILEYLREARGAAVWPVDAQARVQARQLAYATDGNLGALVYRPLADQLFLTKTAARDQRIIGRALDKGRAELARLEDALRADFFCGEAPCAADFTVYGLLAFLAQIGRHYTQADLKPARGPQLEAWRRRIEALPYFASTWPSQWPPVEET